MGMKIFFRWAGLSILLALCACENDLAEVNRLVQKEEVFFETAKEVEMLYSDSAIVRVRIKSPTLRRYLDKQNPREVFPDGILVEFLSEYGRPTSHLSARQAIRYEKENRIIVRDSVVWVSRKKERLETEELIFEEENDRVYTDKFVTILRQDEIIYGYGFESNQEFTHYKINAIEGRVKVDHLKN